MFLMRYMFNKTIVTKQLNVLKNALISRRYNDVRYEDIPNVSPTLIKKVLKANNVNYEEGFTCFILACPVCQKRTKLPPANKAYINKTTGVFLCPTCKSNGNWSVIEEYLDAKKSEQSRDTKQVSFTMENNKILEYLRKVGKTTNLVKDLNAQSQADILKNFNLPKLGSQALEAVDTRIDYTYDNLYFPLKTANFEIVGYKIINKSHTQNIQPIATCGGILIAKSTKSRGSAVIVPNVADFLILLDAKVTMSIICLPNGITNLSQYILPCFESFNKLILWFGNDVQSWNNARSFAKKLNEKRCLFVRPMEKQQLPHVKPNQDFKSIISSAQPIWHKSITTFVSLREDVLSDLQNIDKVQGIKWKRYPTLSKILKGHRRGELTVITGPTGSGKTTFISEYSLDLAMQGVNTLWGSFEIRNARLARTMLQQMAGIPLDENLEKFDFWADHFEKLPIYFMTFHGQQAIKVVMEAIEHATYVHDISHVIIDNVQFMMGTTDDSRHMDRFWKQDVLISQFRNFATRKNCHVTLVIHPRKERDSEDLTTSSIFGGAKASQEADNVLIIQDKRLTSVRGKKYLQIAKNRYSGDLGIMALDFDKASLSYAQKKKKTLEEKINDRPVDNHKTEI